MRRDIVSIRISILSASGFRRKNSTVHQYPLVADDVLLTDIGNHTVDVSRSTSFRQVHLVHDGPSRTIRSDNDHYTKRPLSQTEHAQNGAVGEVVLYQKCSENTIDACSERPAHRTRRQ